MSASKLLSLVVTTLVAVSAAKCPGHKTYTLMMRTSWKESTHPVAYPKEPAFFTEILSFTHNGDATLFKVGEKPSPGLKSMVTKFEFETLLFEIADKFTAKSVKDFFQSPVFMLADGGHMFARAKVDSDNTRVSFISAMKPTGRYFVGADNIDLCDSATGTWRDIRDVSLEVFDVNPDTGLISKVKCGEGFLCEKGDILPLAKVDIFDQPCFGNFKYTVKFTANWTREAHPVDFPWNAKFSKLVGVSHSDQYNLFSVGEYASSGLQELAENAKHNDIIDELAHEKDMGPVKDFFLEADRPKNKAGFTIYPLGPSYLQLTVDSDHPFISFVAKVVPSPDWFVGVNAIDMCDRENGQWKKFIDAPALAILPYDAGSLEADTFSQVRPQPLPKEDKEIRVVKCGKAFCEGSGDVNPPLGYAYIYASNTDPFKPEPKQSGGACIDDSKAPSKGTCSV